MSTITDRIGNLEIRDNAVAANAERLPYEVYDVEHPNRNYPVLVATFSNRVDAIQYAQIVTGEGGDDDEEPIDYQLPTRPRGLIVASPLS